MTPIRCSSKPILISRFSTLPTIRPRRSRFPILQKLIDYQSQYVKVYSQPIESIRGEMYYNVSSGYANQTFETKNGSTFQLSFNSYSSSWANSIEIPAKAGYIKGCVSINQGQAIFRPAMLRIWRV